MKSGKQIAALFLTSAIVMTTSLSCLTPNVQAADGPPNVMPQGEPPQGMPDGPGPGTGGPPGGGSAALVTKLSLTEGDWSFDLVTTTSGSVKSSTSTLTYYAGKTDELVIVPSVLGGAPG
jgi:hypothetical protein